MSRRTRSTQRGRPRRPLPVPEAEVCHILQTQTLRAAGTRLGISSQCAYLWRQRLGLGNPHLPYTYPQNHPMAKGLTLEVIGAALRAHPGSRQVVGLLAQLLGCSKQAVYQKLERLERRGLVTALYRPSGRRHGWVVGESHGK